MGKGGLDLHDVHATKLRPHLDGHAEDDAPDDTGFGEGGEGSVGLLALEGERFFDFLVLGQHFGVGDVSATMEVGKHLDGFLPAVFGREPTG